MLFEACTAIRIRIDGRFRHMKPRWHMMLNRRWIFMPHSISFMCSLYESLLTMV